MRRGFTLIESSHAVAQSPRRRGSTKAFTLIELSIVLVIIGLIVGGVLVGQDLINAAQLRSQISQIDKFQLAARTFELKYNCVAGDCANAVNFGLGVSGGVGKNGDGNGSINTSGHEFGGGAWAAYQQEKLNFWYHLGQAGLIAEQLRGYDTDTTPTSITAMQNYHPTPKIGSAAEVAGQDYLPAIIPFSIDGQNGFALISVFGEPDVAGYHNTIDSMDASAIDSKLDDGIPFTGNVVLMYPYSGVIKANGGGCVLPVPPYDKYDTAGTFNHYTGANESTPNPNRIECGLLFLNRF